MNLQVPLRCSLLHPRNTISPFYSRPFYKLTNLSHKTTKQQQQNEPGRELPALRCVTAVYASHPMVFRSIAAAAASTAASSSSASSSAAAQTIQRRAIQCSFSSVFHLRNAGAGRKEAQEAERIFFNAVAIPMGIMGLIGGAAFVHKSLFVDEAHTCRR